VPTSPPSGSPARPTARPAPSQPPARPAPAGKLAAVLRDGLLPTSVLQQRLQSLVLDEADLLLSYGYGEDLALIAPQVWIGVDS
jgi:hypothetical protein